MALTPRAISALTTVETTMQEGDWLVADRAGVPFRITHQNFQAPLAVLEAYAALPLGTNQLWTFHTGAPQRMTISPFMRGVNVSADGPAARTALGLGTLATQDATAVTLAGANPALSLNDTSGTPTTHQIVDVRYDDSTLSFDVRDSVSGFVGRGFQMTTDASGAATYTLRVATTDRLVVNSGGVGVTGVLSVTGNAGVAGNITPVGGNRDLGTFLNPWQNLHVVNSLVQSDERKKKNFGEFSKADFAAALKIKFQPFTLKADGRETSGYVAQQIIAAFGGEARPMQLGLIHKSEDGFYSVSYELVSGLRIEAIAQGVA